MAMAMSQQKQGPLAVAVSTAFANPKALPDAVTNSRNWVLSLAMSHSYIQTVLFKRPEDILSLLGITAPAGQLKTLFGRAVQVGVADGDRDLLLGDLE